MQFVDLAAQQARLKNRLDAAIARVLAHGQYIQGPEVRALEEGLAALCGAKHARSCANGTDALQLALMALGVRPGDAVFCPAFTFAATAEVVPFLGATPVFVDVDPYTFNMDVESLGRAVAHARTLGLQPAAVIPVDLFGLPADYDAIEAAADGLPVIADTAQGYGAHYKGRRAGGIGRIATTSFYPAKPLGCYGDGGAVFTSDDTLAALLDSYRIHGKGAHQYDCVRIGMNSRLDTLQAAILLEKLAVFEDEIAARQRVADRYDAGLAGVNGVATPHVPEGLRSSWAQYTLAFAPEIDRNGIQAALKAGGVPSVVYYPKPMHRQPAYETFPTDPAGLPVCEDLCARVLSLPMHPYLAPDDQDRIIAAVRDALGG